MARLSNKNMKKRLRSLHLNLFFVHYFSTRDLLAISARIAATHSSCLNIKTVSTFRGDTVLPSLNKESKISGFLYLFN